MRLLNKHPLWIFPLSFSFLAICLVGLAIWGTKVFWMFFAVPWGGSLLFLAIGDWLESETRARRKRARQARRRARGAAVAVRRSH